MVKIKRTRQNAHTPFRLILRDNLKSLVNKKNNNKSHLFKSGIKRNTSYLFLNKEDKKKVRNISKKSSLIWNKNLERLFLSFDRKVIRNKGKVKSFKPLARREIKQTKTRKFIIQNYRSEDHNLSIEDFLRTIRLRALQQGGKLKTIRLQFGDGNSSEYLNIPSEIIQNGTIKDIQEYIESKVFNKETGSDLINEASELNITWFNIGTIHIGGGDFKRHRHGNKKTLNMVIDGIICEDFKSKNNNCLFEILRNVFKIKDTSNKIRNKLNIPINENIDISQLGKIEEYLNKSIGVLVESKTVKKFKSVGKVDDFTYKNINKFECEVNYNDTYLRGSENSDVVLFLRDDHYTLVKCRKNKTRCIRSGLEIMKSRTKASHKDIIKELKSIGLLTDNVVEVDKKEKKDKKKKYWFFDYETVYDIFGYLKPYSVACVYGSSVVVDEKEPEEEKEPDEGFIIENFKEEGRFFELSDNCNENFVNWMMDKRSFDDENILVGFNNSRFDNFILCEELMRRGVLNTNSLMFAGNSILKMTFDSFKTIDLCRFVMNSLENACKGFKCKFVKGKLSHNEVQDLYFNDMLNFFKNIKNREDEIKNYNIMDCLSLSDLYFKFSNKIKDETNLDLEKFSTISQLTYKFWCEGVKGEDKPEPPKTREIWDFFKTAVVAGRSQIFKKGHFKGEMQSMDVKSLYPYIMIYCDFPIGQEIETDVYKKGKLGIYKCVIKKQPKDNIIPLRSKDAPLNWTYNGEIEVTLSSVDIENILDFEGEVEIKEGYYWEKSSKDVFKCLKPLMNAKNLQDFYKIKNDDRYNPALRSVLKLLMNSLSGKVIQRIFDDITKLLFTDKDVKEFIDDHNNVNIDVLNNTNGLFMKGSKKVKSFPKTVKPNYLGVFIYSYARTHMYKSVISKIENKYAMDTDSLHAPIEEFKKLKQEQGYGKYYEAEPTNAIFGDFEGEISFKVLNSYYVAPKCYGIFGKKHSKMRFKGIGARDKISNMNPDDFRKLSIQEQFKIYENSEKALSEQLYKTLTDGKPVTIICSQIKRVFTTPKGDDNDFAKLKQVFTIKTIKGI